MAATMQVGFYGHVRQYHNLKAELDKAIVDVLETGQYVMGPTLSRFENALGPKALMRMGCALADTVLDAAIETVAQSKSRPVVHSDRGAHYRWPGWLSRIGDANLIRSMSRKGCSPDNAACEGFFGRLKTELFYPRDWKTTTIEQFIQVVDTYIRWYNEKRIKISLGSLSPIEYRESLGLTA
mgnify:CR=1 FL=1